MTARKICEYCGRQFSYSVSRGDTDTRRYCCIDCLRKDTAAIMKKRKAPGKQVEHWEQIEMWWQK